ncbi:hypothetical protein MHAE_07034 [Mycobacterium haemophilum DSM 44634]|nr:hypothetical protein [Mycobacterium haemophilum]
MSPNEPITVAEEDNSAELRGWKWPNTVAAWAAVVASAAAVVLAVAVVFFSGFFTGTYYGDRSGDDDYITSYEGGCIIGLNCGPIRPIHPRHP